MGERILIKEGFHARIWQTQGRVRKETADAKVAELEEQLRLTTIATLVEIAKEQAEPYFKMRHDIANAAVDQFQDAHLDVVAQPANGEARA